MNSILVPTLAELRVELDLAGAQRTIAEKACEAEPSIDERHATFDLALTHFWSVIDLIAEAPAASIADLRIKAYAFDWAARLTDDEPYHSPSAGEEKILHQLVAGLLDDRIAP